MSSVRGPGGGYRLSRGADLIDVAAIIDAVNESVDATSCSGKGNCQDGEICLTHHLWQELSDQIYQFLSGISLGDLTARADIQSICLRQNEVALVGGEPLIAATGH